MSMEEFREKVLERGASSIKGIVRTFRKFDQDGSHELNLEEFSEVVKDYGLDFSADETKQLFATLDKDGKGSFNFDEFLVGLRGSLSGERLLVVKEAFQKADRSGDGVLDAEDMKGAYNARQHPQYQSGELDENQVFTAFLNKFEPDESKRDGKVTEEEFINYYAGVSAGIDNDADFNLMIRSAWKI